LASDQEYPVAVSSDQVREFFDAARAEFNARQTGHGEGSNHGGIPVKVNS